MEPYGVFAIPDQIEDRIDDLQRSRRIAAELRQSIQSARQLDSEIRFDRYSTALGLCIGLEEELHSMELSLQSMVDMLRQAESETAELLEQCVEKTAQLLG